MRTAEGHTTPGIPKAAAECTPPRPCTELDAGTANMGRMRRCRTGPYPPRPHCRIPRRRTPPQAGACSRTRTRSRPGPAPLPPGSRPPGGTGRSERDGRARSRIDAAAQRRSRPPRHRPDPSENPPGESPPRRAHGDASQPEAGRQTVHTPSQRTQECPGAQTGSWLQLWPRTVSSILRTWARYREVIPTP